MPQVVLETRIDVPIDTCFDLARDIDVHAETTRQTGERAVAGVLHGKIEAGDTVTFEAKHLGVRQRLSSRMTQFDPPHLFADEMTEGAFKSLTHVHEFFAVPTGTLMRDTLTWVSPLGVLGTIADRLFLTRHMRNFVTQRNQKLKEIAEARDSARA